ncbi:MAG: 5-bromo-4-chloroindolyl phosphate hydrolysis family protein [bacterium]|nr:5-bromo-4-chloroindolyl phosphate hydrolysis family protein [bacterium]
MIKKRYLYAPLLASILFIILYLILDFDLILSLILTVITYFAGIFLYKEKDVRKYDPDLIMHYCYLISKINNYSSKIENEELNKNILEMTSISEKIISMLEQKPNKVTQVYDGFDYYLPLTIKIINQYIYLHDKTDLTSDEEKFMKSISNYIKKICNEIDKLHKNMNYTKMLDINSSIDIFRKDNDVIENLEKRSIDDVEGR